MDWEGCSLKYDPRTNTTGMTTGSTPSQLNQSLLFVCLGVGVRALCMLDMHSTTKLYPPVAKSAFLISSPGDHVHIKISEAQFYKRGYHNFIRQKLETRFTADA